MWKYIPTLDDDKEAGTITAQLVDDNDNTKVLFTYSARVTFNDEDMLAFIRKARSLLKFHDDRLAKITQYLTKLSTIDSDVEKEPKAEAIV